MSLKAFPADADDARPAPLLLVQRPGNGRVSSKAFPADADDARPAGR